MGWLSFAYEDFEFTKGQPTRYRFGQEDASWAARRFCRRCGVQLAYDCENADSIDVITETFDAPDAYPPDSHEWVTEKLSRVELWSLDEIASERAGV